MSNWWYWRPFGSSAPATIVLASRLLPAPAPETEAPAADPVAERLQEAVAARRKSEGATTATARGDDYWTPQLNLPSSASPPSIPQRGRDAPQGDGRRRRAVAGEATAGPRRKGASIDLTAPLLLGIISAGFVGYNGEEMAGGGGGGIQEHFGSAVALGIVNVLIATIDRDPF
ncbi:hypothetical protein HU200_006775 [Digitaria exilis]|uniref:Uncharacterized protein n=1 Tax=Digitaria exilis TaxID=1010633 RepID=A0A835KRS3_9POAL|nr:hypothetical protein HU200_006775 [Digitaria exilis]